MHFLLLNKRKPWLTARKGDMDITINIDENRKIFLALYPGEIEIDEKGNVISTYNPDAKWDWYVRGGRWAGYLWLKEGTEPLVPVNFSWGWSEEEKQKVIDENRADVAVKKDIANLDNIIPFAIVKDGHWYEKGQMGWWAVVLNEKDDHIWEEEVKKLLEGLSEDTIISIYDCHI